MKKASELWKYVSMRGLKPTPKTLVSTWADTMRTFQYIGRTGPVAHQPRTVPERTSWMLSHSESIE